MKKRSRRSPNISGALLIDKSEGGTSYDVIRALKREYGFDRIGHAGTLDPLATGLLVVLLGEATRLQSIIMDSRKSYVGEIRLGAETASDDITGEVTKRDEVLAFRDRPQSDILAEIQETFRGKIMQRPPGVSAIKVSGRRSYELARNGEAPELAEREIEIFSLKVQFVDELTLSFQLECSKGTYVRSLARDIGMLLGSAACVQTLRRVSSGEFSVSDALPQENIATTSLSELRIVSLSQLVGHLPALTLPDADIAKLRLGDQRPLMGCRAAETGIYSLWSTGGTYCGLLESSPETGLAIRYLSTVSAPQHLAGGHESDFPSGGEVLPQLKI